MTVGADNWIKGPLSWDSQLPFSAHGIFFKSQYDIVRKWMGTYILLYPPTILVFRCFLDLRFVVFIQDYINCVIRNILLWYFVINTDFYWNIRLYPCVFPSESPRPSPRSCFMFASFLIEARRPLFSTFIFSTEQELQHRLGPPSQVHYEHSCG